MESFAVAGESGHIMIWIRYIGHVPAKSNSYEIVTRYTKAGKRATLKKRDDIVVFEDQLARKVENLCKYLGEMPYPTEKLELWVLWHRLTTDGKRRDLSNLMKSTEDAITKGGLWNDDSQVSRIEQQVLYDAEDSEWMEIIVRMDPLQPKHKTKRTSSSAKRASSV